MCNQPNPQQPDTTTDRPPQPGSIPALELEISKANLELQLAQIRSAAEYNRSDAGQLQRQFETYQRIAKPLSESQFIPDAYKGRIGDCIIAIEMASRMGVLPLAVMQNLCIVKGNPTWKSKFLIGCVNTCGRYSTLDYRYTTDGIVGDISYKTWEKGRDGKKHEVLRPFGNPDLSNLTCVAFAIEKSTGRTLTSPPVSIRMAVAEGWYTKDGSKWPTMPELMLRYRAASYWVSTFAPEMSMGFHTTEEARDIEDVNYEDISPLDSSRPQLRPEPASISDAKERLRARGKASKASAGDNNDTTPAPASEMP